VKFYYEELLGKLGNTLVPEDALFVRKVFGLPDELSVSNRGVVFWVVAANGLLLLFGGSLSFVG